jgi:UDP-2,3-diacylglucosamine pyrophosphatase LpxH
MQAALGLALPGVQRLVLLGDIVELRHGPIRDALGAAQPVLEAIGAALPRDAEVVLVPGNHDHELMAPYLARRAWEGEHAPLGLETPVSWQPGEPLARLAHWLAPARVRAAYPGVWLSGEVYATHGHYLDLHTTVPLLERLGAGVMARIVGGPAPSDAEGYEAILAPIYAWIHALAQRRGAAGAHSPSSQAWRVLNSSARHDRVRRSMMRALLALGVRVLGRGGLGELRADVSTAALRVAALAAMGQVADHIAPGARELVFGHTHRAGPLPGDARAEWISPTGVRLINCGCWVHDPAYLGRDPATSPYRPGFAVQLDDGYAPQLVNLLD